MDDDKVLEALSTLQDYCNKFEDCKGCRITNDDGKCSIRDKIPMNWKINKDKKIKYIL